MNNKDFLAWLREKGACHAAIKWVTDTGYSRRETWDNCERGDWLLWWAARDGFSHVEIVQAACACARTALQYVPAGEDRPRLAIEAAERWCDDPGQRTAYAAAVAAADAADAAAYAADSEMADIVRGIVTYKEHQS